MNRATFFAAVRASPFGGNLTRPQVDGITAILDEWDKRRLTDIRWLAYMLATTFHETGEKMQPINEAGGPNYFAKYDGREDLGNTLPGDGARFHGRGFVQLTGRRNYQRASDKFKVDIVASPDLAKRLDLAADIMFSGMTEGWFTGKKLADYINNGFCDYSQARRIVNGTDRAVTIAGYAVQFERALKAAEAQPMVSDQPVIPTGPVPTLSPRQPDDPGPPPMDINMIPEQTPGTEPPASRAGFFVALARLFAAVWAAVFPKKL